MGKVHKRSGNCRNSEGIQNSLVKDDSPGQNSELSSGKEIKEMLEKGAIKKLSQHIDAQNQFLSNFFFLVRKKDGGYRPVINLKTLNQFVSYMHFKMESLQTLKYMMKERDYICKTDLKALYLQYL